MVKKQLVAKIELTPEEASALVSLLEWVHETYRGVCKPEVWNIEDKIRKVVVSVGFQPATIDYSQLRH